MTTTSHNNLQNGDRRGESNDFWTKFYRAKQAKPSSAEPPT